MHPHMLVGGGVLCKPCLAILAVAPAWCQSVTLRLRVRVWGCGETGRGSDKDTDNNTERVSRDGLTPGGPWLPSGAG